MGEDFNRDPLYEDLVQRLDPAEAAKVDWVTPGQAKDGSFYLYAALDSGDEAPYDVGVYGPVMDELPAALAPKVKKTLRAFAAADEAFRLVMESEP